MKTLNYLPKEIQERRWMKVLTRLTLIVAFCLASVIAILFLQVDKVKKDIKDKQDQLVSVSDLESSIMLEELKLHDNTVTNTFIYTNPLAINRLLGVLLTRTPQDVVISTVFTETERQRRLGTMQSELPTVPQELETPVSSEENPTPDEPQEVEQPVAPQIDQAMPNTYEDPQTIIIRGSALDLQSISLLAYTLKNEPYVQSVELSPIENYNDGYFNHKLFELTLVLVRGR